MMFGCGVWSGMYALQLAAADLGTKKLLWTVDPGGPLTVVGWFAFAAAYAGYDEWAKPKRLALLGAEPFLFALVIRPTNGFHHLAAERVYLRTLDAGFVVLESPNAILAEVDTVYVYGLVLVGLYFIAQRLVGQQEIYSRQGIMMGFAALIPLVANILFVTGQVELAPTVNPTGATFAATGVFFAIAIFRFGMLDVVPVARKTGIQNMMDGYIVVDDGGTIVDVNPAAQRQMSRVSAQEFSADGGGFIGAPADETPLLEQLPDFDSMVDEDTTEVNVEIEGESENTLEGVRTFEIRASELGDDRTQGYLLLVRDITEQKHRERELELRTRQLDNFVAALSDDIEGSIRQSKATLANLMDNMPDELQRERGKLYAVYKELETVEGTTQEVVDLARGEGIVDPDDTDRCNLEAVAESAWYEAQVPKEQKEAAGMEVEYAAQLYADGDRIVRMLSELVENALIHADKREVRIDVGILTDGSGVPHGIAVEDNGPGLPDDEEVFELGVTTEDDHAGIGLALVETIADAHGWTVRHTTRSGKKGARFEITGIEFPQVAEMFREESKETETAQQVSASQD